MDEATSAQWSERLRQERIRHNWRQQDLADQLGTTVITVKRWERGRQLPSSYFRQKLCALFEKSAEELGFVPDTVFSPQNMGTEVSAQEQVPGEREPEAQQTVREQRLRSMFTDHQGFLQDRLESFVGREQELEEILQQVNVLLPTGGYFTITGQAGQGKSSMVAKLVELAAEKQGGLDHIAFHFIPLTPPPDYQVALLRNLMARLILKHELSDLFLASESRAALSEGFLRILKEIAEKGRQEIIFIDGLDQLQPDQQTGVRDLSFLPQGPGNPPPGIVFVLGTRPSDTLRPLELLKPSQEYPLPHLSRTDFDAILRHCQVELEPTLADTCYETLDKNVLYLDLVAKELATRHDRTHQEVEETLQQIADDPQKMVSLIRDHLPGRQVSFPFPSGTPEQQADPDWDRMLGRLRRSYKELLGQSLHGIAWMDLGLSTRPDLVSNVTNLLFRLPQGGERLLALGTSILDAYDEAEGELLILGAPGAGKSTLLLDLAQHLVGRAHAGELLLLPVLLPLSSWALRRLPLTDWMVEQLSRTYDVPLHLSERWVKEGRLLPLLDGLDEMEEAARPACIAAINTYHRTRLTPLVVCSRQVEYEGSAERECLALQSAVIVQPMSEEQIEAYLSAVGPAFVGVRDALSQEQALRELATTPLMLSVLLLTYRGATASEIMQQGTELEQHVWTDYVARQVAEKGNPTCYPLERTRAWLSWLAQQMRVHQQTTFYAEYLQSDWLALDQQPVAMWLAVYLPAMLIGGCVCLLTLLLVQPDGNDYVSLLQLGLLGGFVGGCLSQHINAESTHATHRLSPRKWVHLSLAMLLGLLLAASFGLYLYPPQPRMGDPGYSFIDWMRDGSIVGIGSGLSLWLFQRLLHRLSGMSAKKTSERAPRQKGLVAWFTRTTSLPVWQAATALGAGWGLSYGLSTGLSNRLNQGLSYWLDYALSGGLSGLSTGLLVSIMVMLVYIILADSMKSLRFAERIHWSWHALLQPQHLRISGSIAGAAFLFFGLMSLFFDLISWLSNELSTWLGDGMVYGQMSAGLRYWLSQGLSVGLSFWLLVGLYQGIQQEHLENQDRQQFNQGIRCSLRNGLLVSLISAVIISTIGVLNIGLGAWQNGELNWMLSIWLNYGLNYGLSQELSFAWILLPVGLVVMWALSGGLTILRHYAIRWLLARHRTFPWRAQAFLDDATTRILLRRVGGGYSFIHRRLQDYLVEAAEPPPQQ